MAKRKKHLRLTKHFPFVALRGPEKLTYCIAKGAAVYLPTDKWKRVYSGKSLCGRLVRVTAIKGKGGIHNMQDVGIIKVRGHELATHPKNLKLVGRG